MKERRNTRSSTSKGVSAQTSSENKDKVAVYKRTSLRTINKDAHKQKRRITRQSSNIYDFDVSNEPALPFKKTRDGFKLKTTIAKKRLEMQKNKKQVKKQKNNSKELIATKSRKKQIDVLENIVPDKGVDKSNRQLTSNRYNQPSNKEVSVQLLEEDNNFDDLIENDIELINDASHCGESSNVMPENSTPIITRTNNKSIDLKRSLYEDFVSPITKPNTRTTCSPQKSPWRMSTFENNRLPANFPVKSSLLPIYDKNMSLRHSTLESSSPRISLRPTSPTPARLFEDETPMNENHISQENINTQKHSYNSNSSLHEFNQTKSDISEENSNENTLEKSNLFGFQSTIHKTRVLRTRNENVPKPTRVSLREIKNVLSNCKKQKGPEDKENSHQQSPKKNPCIISSPTEVPEIAKDVECTNDQEIQSNPGDRILLFEDPDELYPTLNRDESLQCYKPTGKKHRKPIFERQYDKVNKPKKVKAKDKLSTEEWVAAKKWERSFNAMVEEVENFEMVIE